ncbi:MAG: prolipoprotein diacylglyceryl transferase [Oscillospiraceae bacterium]|jgi:phosphatidylglycerol:prolipoprotein diacylglycerol transferase|nr:prolipoprotein diacylglyceryl transferase [Oscillospiraceae bacterium]
MTQLFSSLPIPPYSLLRIIAIVFSLIFVILKRKSFGITLPDTLKMAAFAVFGAIAGAKVLYCIGQIVLHASEPAFWSLRNWNTLIRAGGVLYGSLLGIIGMIFLFAKLFNYKAIDLLGLASIALFGANFFSRLGCLLAGCCYGIQFSNGKQFPYQLSEGILCALVFFCFVLWKPEQNRRSQIFPISMMLYGIIRFALEFFRGDESRGIWLLSTSQWISVIFISVSILWLLKARKT